MGNVKNLVEASPGQAMSLSQLDLADGAEWQSKGDPAATEVLYFVSGTGSLKVGGETLPLAAESMVYLPQGTPYAIKVALPDRTDKADKPDKPEKADKILAVQFKVTVRK